MPRNKYVQHFDVKAPDNFVTRKRIEDWLESHLEYIHVHCGKPGYALDEYGIALSCVIPFLVDVGLMKEADGKRYLNIVECKEMEHICFVEESEEE